MKNFKKIISLCLALMLCLSCVPAAFAAEVTEIMYPGNSYSLFIHGFDDACHLGDGQTVRGFDILKPQLANFIADSPSVSVTGAVPARGENIHNQYSRAGTNLQQKISAPSAYRWISMQPGRWQMVYASCFSGGRGEKR